MMYIPLPESLLERHKKFVLEDGKLHKKLEALQGQNKNDISSKILTFVSENLNEIVACNFEGLKEMRDQYVQLIGSMDEFSRIESNDYRYSDIDKFQKVHSQLEKVFVKYYESFKEVNPKTAWNSYIYIMELGQTVCPYCNANFIQTVQSGKRLKGTGSQVRADLDHFLPKSVYPIFAVTLSNLIPSCMYCNQRFKSAHQTNFHDYLSPFDPEITDAITFNINYEQDKFSSVFDKLEHTSPDGLLDVENRYIKLLSLKNEDLDKEIVKQREYLNEFERMKREIEKQRQEFVKKNEVLELGNLILAKDNQKRKLVTFNSLIDTLLKKSTEYIEQTEGFIDLLQEKGFAYAVNNYADEIVLLYNEFSQLVEESREYSRRKIKKEVGKAVTDLNREMKKHKEYLEKTFSIERFDPDPTDERFEFVDVALGYSTNYQIEITANEAVAEEIQRKTYNHAALFQLETVYNQFHSYINRRIRQSHILNDLYKSQLAQQFPNLLNEPKNFDLGEVLLIAPESQRHEVLGKLTHDVILPAVKSENKLELLKDNAKT